MPGAQRARILWRVADLIEEHADELARLETRDQGQPLSISAGFSVPMAAEVFRYYAGWCTKIESTAGPVTTPDVLHYTRREPVGVAALITPWNFPLMIAAWKLAPALAAGNTVILKPSELTPLTTIRLARFCIDAGVPAGAVNLLTGDGDLGQALVEHPDVDKVSFTGSTEVGRAIVHASADSNLKRLSLELGGKAPSIIARDADIDAAVVGCLQGGRLPAIRRRQRRHAASVLAGTVRHCGLRPPGRRRQPAAAARQRSMSATVALADPSPWPVDGARTRSAAGLHG